MAGSAAPTRVLVVDDEPGITDLVSMALRYEGLSAEAVHTGAEALRSVARERPHLMVLDVMLPDLDGFEVMRRLSADLPRIPVLFLTARDELEDKLRGFTLGGDDYVTKPFRVEELIVRVRAILRRAHEIGEEPGIVRYEDLVLDEDRHEVTRAGYVVELTPTEFRLLHYLMLNSDRVVSKYQILDRVWQADYDGDGNVVEIFVSTLRRKLEAHGPRLIHTVRGVGYRLRRPPVPGDGPDPL
ncbi:MAG: response regulator transcription factor [Actinomycetota bacterium]|nr:response regulator transcription factor [Actinomycetota bacterium]